MSKLIRKDETLDAAVYSRDLREYVVPTREIKKLKTFEEPKEGQTDYADMLRVMFNRCIIRMSAGGAMCLFCGMKEACQSMRSVMQPKEET